VAAIAAGLTWFIDDQGMKRGLLAASGLAVVLWLVTTRRIGLALALFAIYLGALDGYLKLSSGSGAVKALRDVLLLAILAGVLLRAVVQGTRYTTPPLTGWVVAFAALVLVQFANPQAGTLVHSLAGARQQLEFVPLFFLTFAFVRTKRSLRGFVLVLLVVAVANGIAGFAQFRLTPQELAAWGPGYAERVLGQGQFVDAGRTFWNASGNYVRPFGLGSEAGSGGLLGAFALGGVIAAASLVRRPGYVLLAGVSAIGAVAAIVTSQGRAVIVCSVVVALMYALLTITSRGRIARLLGLAAAAVVAFAVVSAIVGAGDAFTSRYQSIGPASIVKTTDDARGGSLAIIPRTAVHYPLGAGLGTAGPAAGAGGANELAGTLDSETEPSFLIIETGIAGMVLMLSFVVALVVLALRRCREEPDPEARALLAAVLAPLAALLALCLVSAWTPTTPGGPYLWAAAGVASYWLIALPAERRVRAPQGGRAQLPFPSSE
jgi:putative inorganic carbon (HCO3(-)) transporter